MDLAVTRSLEVWQAVEYNVLASEAPSTLLSYSSTTYRIR